MAEQSMETVRIKIEHRAGSIYVSSDDVPGLWLWGKDSDQVLNNVAPAIKALYKYNRGIEVEVEEVPVSRVARWLLRHLLKPGKPSDKYRIQSGVQNLNRRAWLIHRGGAVSSHPDK